MNANLSPEPTKQKGSGQNQKTVIARINRYMNRD